MLYEKISLISYYNCSVSFLKTEGMERKHFNKNILIDLVNT